MEPVEYRIIFSCNDYPDCRYATFHRDIYTLINIFIIECLARIEQSTAIPLHSIYRENLNQWENEEGKLFYSSLLTGLYNNKTLVSRFTMIAEQISEICKYSNAFMKHVLSHKAETQLSTRQIISEVGNIFKIYIKLRDIIYPTTRQEQRLIGYIGVKNNSLFLYYTERVMIIDHSTISSISDSLPFYLFNPNKNHGEIESFYITKANSMQSTKLDSSRSQVFLLSPQSSYQSEEKNESKVNQSKNSSESSLQDESICAKHNESELLRIGCGVKHCLECMYEKIKTSPTKAKCSCGYDISQKEIGDITRKHSNKYNPTMTPPSNLIKDLQSSNQKSNSITLKPVPKNYEPHSQPVFAVPKQSSEVLIKTPYSSPMIACQKCNSLKLDSEFAISCNCAKQICLQCRSQSVSSCIACRKIYEICEKTSLEILSIYK